MKKEVVLCDICQSVIGPDNRSKFEPVPYVMGGGFVMRVSVVIDSPQPVDICWSLHQAPYEVGGGGGTGMIRATKRRLEVLAKSGQLKARLASTRKQPGAKAAKKEIL